MTTTITIQLDLDVLDDKKVSGRLESRDGTFYAIIELPKGPNEKRNRKTHSLGIRDVRGNKRKAEGAMDELVKQYQTAIDQAIDAEQKKADGKEVLPENARSSKANIDFFQFMVDTVDRKFANGEIQETTYVGYCGHLAAHLKTFFGIQNPVLLSEITEENIKEFLDFLYIQRRKKNTIKNYYSVLHLCLEHAKAEKKLIRVHPMDDIPRPSTTADLPVSSFYTADEAKELLRASVGDPIHICIVITLFYGLRRSECIGILKRNIDFHRESLLINHKVVKGIDNKLVSSNKMKTRASLRTYPFVTDLDEFLKAELAQQEQYKKAFGRDYSRDHSEYLCVRPDGRLLDPDYVSSHFKVLLRKNGLRNIRWHDLRHSCASLLVSYGVPMKRVQEWLGHAHFQTTANFYSHLDTTSKLETASVFTKEMRLNDIITPEFLTTI